MTGILLLLAATSYGAELSIDSGTAKSNEAVALSVHLTSAAEALTGLQFDLEYDASALDVSVEAGPSAEKAGKSLQAARTASSGQRVLIIGFNRNNLSDGVVAVLHVSVKENHGAAGDYPIRLTALAGTNARAESVAVTGRQASFKVPSVRNSTR
jgi:hypothetical protein